MFLPGDSASPQARILWTSLILLIVVAPFAILFVEAGIWIANERDAGTADFLTWGRQSGLLARSTAFAASVAIGDLLIGTLVAAFFWTWSTGTSRVISLAMLSMIAVPPYLHALAWRNAIDGINVLVRAPGAPGLAFAGWGAAWWVQTMALAPVAAGLALLGLQTVDRRLFDAGRVMRPDMDAFIRIVVPLATPPILAAAGFVFLFTLVDYSVPSLFQLNTYALDIFAEFSANHVAARALVISLPFLTMALLVVLVIQELLRQAALRPPAPGQAWSCAPAWPAWFNTLQGLAVAVLALQVGVPALSLITLAGSWSDFWHAVSSVSGEILLTARTAAIASFVCLPLGLFAANRILGAQRRWWLVMLVPLGVPGPLIGIGLITLWNNAFTAAVYDSELVLVLTYLARFMPAATLILFAQLRRLDPLLLDAARLLRPSTLQLWTQVYVPLLLRAGAGAALLVFALSIGELPASLLTVPPGESTLTMRIYSYMHYGASEKVAGLSLAIPLMTMACATVLSAAAYAWRFLLPRPAEQRS